MVRRRWVGKCLDLQSLPWLVNDQLINIVQSFSLFTLTCHRKEAENTAAGDNTQRKVGKKDSRAEGGKWNYIKIYDWIQSLVLQSNFDETQKGKIVQHKMRLVAKVRRKQDKRISQVVASLCINHHQESMRQFLSATHSNTEYHDNRLTDDWSGCGAPVSDLTAVWVSSLCHYFVNPASSSALCSISPVNEQT